MSIGNEQAVIGTVSIKLTSATMTREEMLDLCATVQSRALCITDGVQSPVVTPGMTTESAIGVGSVIQS